MSSPPVTVSHEPEKHRFVVVEDGEIAELAYRGGTGGQIVFTHTSVPDALAGRGIGSALAKTGLEYARANNLEVVPLCSFVRSYIERKPEYQSLVRNSTANAPGSNAGGSNSGGFA